MDNDGWPKAAALVSMRGACHSRVRRGRPRSPNLPAQCKLEVSSLQSADRDERWGWLEFHMDFTSKALQGYHENNYNITSFF